MKSKPVDKEEAQKAEANKEIKVEQVVLAEDQGITIRLKIDESDDLEQSPQSPLNDAEKQLLAQCEETIQKGKDSFHQMAKAMYEIRKGRLYREKFKSFRQYCEEHCGFTRSHGDRMAKSGEVILEMTTMGVAFMPQNERQVRKLVAKKKEKPTQVKGTEPKAKVVQEQVAQEPIAVLEDAATETETEEPAEEAVEIATPGSNAGKVVPIQSEALFSYAEMLKWAQEAYNILEDESKQGELERLLKKLKRALGEYAEWEKTHPVAA